MEKKYTIVPKSRFAEKFEIMIRYMYVYNEKYSMHVHAHVISLVSY